jgi:hypothetical protein
MIVIMEIRMKQLAKILKITMEKPHLAPVELSGMSNSFDAYPAFQDARNVLIVMFVSNAQLDSLLIKILGFVLKFVVMEEDSFYLVMMAI